VAMAMFENVGIDSALADIRMIGVAKDSRVWRELMGTREYQPTHVLQEFLMRKPCFVLLFERSLLLLVDPYQKRNVDLRRANGG
jgi:hypothetical protein